MIIETDMKEKENIQAGQIWFNLKSDETIRITNIVPCTGVFGVNAHEEGYGETIKFDDLRKADRDEVMDFRDDSRNYRNVTSIDL
tara:strand:- start:352 stop:606 length:255 start_codon:yes stop_codon:yes gene_type:complete